MVLSACQILAELQLQLIPALSNAFGGCLDR